VTTLAGGSPTAAAIADSQSDTVLAEHVGEHDQPDEPTSVS